MSRASPQMRTLAKRLMACEVNGIKPSCITTPAIFNVCEKMGPHLTTLMGNSGFRALLARALALANVEVPWLRGVQVKADGSLEGLEELIGQLEPEEFVEGRVVLLAQLLGLLVAFIGKNLTLSLVREVWPGVPLNDMHDGKGDKTNEDQE